MKLSVIALALALALPAQAQNEPGRPEVAPGADPSQFKPLPERKGVLSWKLLAQVELIKLKDRYVPQFSAGVAALNQKEVKVQGFMMPLQTGTQQSHFVLSAMPQTCSFCMPGGPEQLVEVKAKKAVKYSFEPVVVTGRLSVLKEDPTGVYYRLSDAVSSQ